MADKNQIENSINYRFKDLGDGSYARVVALDGGVTVGDVEISNDSGNPIPTVSGLQIPQHNSLELSYTGDDVTGVVYKLNGAVVATLELVYTAGKLTSVTKV